MAWTEPDAKAIERLQIEIEKQLKFAGAAPLLEIAERANTLARRARNAAFNFAHRGEGSDHYGVMKRRIEDLASFVKKDPSILECFGRDYVSRFTADLETCAKWARLQDVVNTMGPFAKRKGTVKEANTPRDMLIACVWDAFPESVRKTTASSPLMKTVQIVFKFAGVDCPRDLPKTVNTALERQGLRSRKKRSRRKVQ